MQYLSRDSRFSPAKWPRLLLYSPNRLADYSRLSTRAGNSAVRIYDSRLPAHSGSGREWNLRQAQAGSYPNLQASTTVFTITRSDYDFRSPPIRTARGAGTDWTRTPIRITVFLMNAPGQERRKFVKAIATMPLV